MKLEDISFDLDDKTLFLVDDIKLKADDIRHSILPKLGLAATYVSWKETQETLDFDTKYWYI